MVNHTINATTGPPQFPKAGDEHNIITLSITCPFALIGFVANLLVIAVIICKRSPKKTNNDIFLLNLAIADFLYICFNTGAFVYHLNYFHPYTKTLAFCRGFYPLPSTTFCTGIFTIAAMSIYRCWVIMNPFSPKTRSLWILLCMLFTWIASYSLLAPFAFLSVNDGPGCLIPEMTAAEMNVYFSIITFVQYPLPLVIIFFAYLKIGLYLRKPRVPQMSFVARGKTLVTPRDETRKESIAMTKTVGAIVILFAVLLLPLQIAMQAHVSFKVQDQWTDLLWKYGDRLAMIHSALNPFLYTIRTPQYYQQIMAWITGKPINHQNLACPKTRCQSLSASCATTEFELNERKEDEAVIKLEGLNGYDSRL